MDQQHHHHHHVILVDMADTPPLFPSEQAAQPSQPPPPPPPSSPQPSSSTTEPPPQPQSRPQPQFSNPTVAEVLSAPTGSHPPLIDDETGSDKKASVLVEAFFHPKDRTVVMKQFYCANSKTKCDTSFATLPIDLGGDAFVYEINTRFVQNWIPDVWLEGRSEDSVSQCQALCRKCHFPIGLLDRPFIKLIFFRERRIVFEATSSKFYYFLFQKCIINFFIFIS